MNDIDNYEQLMKKKEEELKLLTVLRIKQLEKTLEEKEKEIKKLEDKNKLIKKDFEYNFELLEERDNDLKIFEEKIDAFVKVIEDNNVKLNEYQDLLDELQGKYEYEKNKRKEEEELNKFKFNQEINKNKESFRYY